MQDEVSALLCQKDHAVQSSAGPSKEESVNFALQQPGPPELNGPRSELTSDPEPGLSLFPAIISPQLVNREFVSLGKADFPPPQGEKVEAQGWQEEDLKPELSQNTDGTAAAATTEQEIQDSSPPGPPCLQPLDTEPRAVLNGCAPQQGQPEAGSASLRAYGEEAPGPAFPRPEPQQDGIPGPASPQPAHPPEETRGQQATDNERPGPAFPAQGSHELGSSSVPEQGAAGQEDQDFTALLIRETVSRPHFAFVLFSDGFFKVCSVACAQSTTPACFSCKSSSLWLRLSDAQRECAVSSLGKLWFKEINPIAVAAVMNGCESRWCLLWGGLLVGQENGAELYGVCWGAMRQSNTGPFSVWFVTWVAW